MCSGLKNIECHLDLEIFMFRSYILITIVAADLVGYRWLGLRERGMYGGCLIIKNTITEMRRAYGKMLLKNMSGEIKMRGI